MKKSITFKNGLLHMAGDLYLPTDFDETKRGSAGQIRWRPHFYRQWQRQPTV